VPAVKPAAVLLGALLVVACATSTPTAPTSPTPSNGATSTPTATATASPTATPTTAASATPTATPGSTGRCPGLNPAGNLVLATLAGSTDVVLRDITNISAPTTVCTLPAGISPHFVTASVVSYAESGPPGAVRRLDLGSSASPTVAASWSAGGFGAGVFDWSPDGTKLTYIAGSGAGGPTWHLVSGGADTTLATLPAVSGRGVNRQQDDFFLGFSPDGQYVAMENTFTGNGSGDQSPLQVRRSSDGSLVYSTSGATMAVWASNPGSLLWRDTAGTVWRWGPGGPPGSSALVVHTSISWVQPHASPDGRWIAYTYYDSSLLPHVGLFSVQGSTLGPQPGGIRSGATFLNNNLLWYQEETPCDCGLAGASQPSGRTFIYDIAGETETSSRISGVYDAWPRLTSPPGLG
jgi:hypothetical protein